MTLRKSWLVAATTAPKGATALDGRLAHAGSYVRNKAGIVRAGVLGYRSGLVSARSDMVLDVGVFEAVLTRSAAYGVTPIANDGVVSVALPASPSSNSRWVRVYAIQHDNVDEADADNEPVLTYVAGNAAASPSLPALPVGAMPIARILQPANVLGTADCTIIEDFPMTAAVGGSVYLRDQAEADAWDAPDGATAYRLDTGEDDVRQGGAWGKIGSLTLVNPGYKLVSGGEPFKLTSKGKRARLRISFDNNVPNTFNNNVQYKFGQVSANMRPGYYAVGVAALNSNIGASIIVIIFPDGGAWFSIGGNFNGAAGLFAVTVDMEWTLP